MNYKIIVITDESFLPKEEEIIVELIKAGAFRIHIRKPKATIDEMRSFLKQIPEEYHAYLSIHDHFELTKEFDQIGIHINTRNPNAPMFFNRCISASCHTEEEIVHNKPHCYYLFLSPCFDSISKKGYKATFSEEQLLQLSYAATVDSKVFALGGITKETIKKAARIGFGGVCVLGYLWESYKEDHNATAVVERFKELQYV